MIGFDGDSEARSIRTPRKRTPREPAFFLGSLDRMFGDKYRASENKGLQRTILVLLTFRAVHRSRDKRPNVGPISERLIGKRKSYDLVVAEGEELESNGLLICIPDPARAIGTEI